MADIQELVKRLRKLCEDNDLEASELVEQLLEEKLEERIHTLLKSVKEALDGFDFAKSLEILDQFA